MISSESSSGLTSSAGHRDVYLRVHGLSKSFGSFLALKNISLDVYAGEFVCFLGPSGCGKTTLLRAIAGLEMQTEGRIEQGGRDISHLRPSQRDFGIVFQSYALFPNLTIEQNVGYGLQSVERDREKIRLRVKELLELVGLPDQGKKYPGQLSGGQQQRIALARALAISPGLLLLDEPLSALDAKVRGHLRHEVKQLQRRLAVTTIMVTHDQEEALSMADRVVVMNHGVIEQIGTPTEIYREPASLFVADFVGSMNKFEVTANAPESVSFGAVNLVCHKHGLAAGSKAILTLRPEDVIPSELGQGDGRNQFKALVRDMEFLGSHWRAWLTSEAFGSQDLDAHFSINAVRRLSITQGVMLTVELPAERLHVFTPEGRRG
ncbi:putative 2-aminoethylphosphonate ABC transporter ATP-binding protein [Aestuariivirga sp.]|uniref:putative 2-aminoethylphosphonate ABC transporter ATP-binding protein n=1 Tax=Aestuariivirga sp. TaxID=2650926 RepID=UPI00391B9EEA